MIFAKKKLSWTFYLVSLFATKSRLLTTLTKKAFKNLVRKEENAGNQYFLLFSQRFLPITPPKKKKKNLCFLSSANALRLD